MTAGTGFPGSSRSLRREYLLAGLAILITLGLYYFTLAPSVEPGDVAELQYAPARLAIPHPNGYPLYMLLGWLWSKLPLGMLAWRMNLLSAVCGALSAGAVYGLARAAGLRRLAAFVAALAWAGERTIWYWSSVADRYSLWMLLDIGMLGALLAWRRDGRPQLLLLAAALFGLSLATHVAAPLFLLPALILLAWPGRAVSPRLLLAALGLALLPLALYLYLPASGAIWQSRAAPDPIFGTPSTLLHGLVHPRFNLAQWWQYPLTGIPLNPLEVLGNAAGNAAWFAPSLVKEQFGLLWLVLAGAGLLLALGRNRPWGVALLVLFVTDVVLALHYLQGNQGAYFLPAALVVVMAVAELPHGCEGLALRLPGQPYSFYAVGGFILLLPLAFGRANSPLTAHEPARDLEPYWRRVLALPLEPGAGLIAHWSDLTPLWYFQQAEDLRPDVLGLYLPDPAQVQAALSAGRPIYLAAPLTGWYQDLPWRVQLVPWGPLVRLAPAGQALAVPDAGTPWGTNFGGEVTLRSAGLPAGSLSAGSAVPITLTWQTTAALPRDTHISLRLYRDQRRAAQQDDRLISAWFPVENLGPDVSFWSQHQLRIPAGLPRGPYQVRAVIYHLEGAELRPENGEAEALIGSLDVGASRQTGTNWLPHVMLSPCLTLVGDRPVSGEVNGGALLELEQLWQVQCQPPGNVALRLAARREGRTWTLGTRPLAELTPEGGWQPGNPARVPLAVRVPGDLPAGSYDLEMTAVDMDQDRPLLRRFGPLPLPGAAHLGTLRVTERPHATEPPALDHPLTASFGPITLLGYNGATAIGAGQPVSVTLAWRAEQAVPTSYTVFLHLLASDGRVVAQRDTLPREGTLPTNAWLPGEVIADSYTLVPAGPLPPGDYTLIAGLYDARTMQRVPVVGSEAMPAGDRVTLGTLCVLP